MLSHHTYLWTWHNLPELYRNRSNAASIKPISSHFYRSLWHANMAMICCSISESFVRRQCEGFASAVSSLPHWWRLFDQHPRIIPAGFLHTSTRRTGGFWYSFKSYTSCCFLRFLPSAAAKNVKKQQEVSDLNRDHVFIWIMHTVLLCLVLLWLCYHVLANSYDPLARILMIASLAPGQS